MAGRITIVSVMLWVFVSAGAALGQDELVLGDFAAKPYGMAPLFKCWLMHGNRYHEGAAADAERKVRPIIAEAKKNGWPEPVFTFLDEPANAGEATRIPALKLAKALRTIKGVKLSGDLNGLKDTDFAPFLDYTGFNDGMDICPATFRKIRDADRFFAGIRSRVNADRSENKPWSYDECQKMRLEAAGHIGKLIAARVKAPE